MENNALILAHLDGGSRDGWLGGSLLLAITSPKNIKNVNLRRIWDDTVVGHDRFGPISEKNTDDPRCKIAEFFPGHVISSYDIDS